MINLRVFGLVLCMAFIGAAPLLPVRAEVASSAAFSKSVTADRIVAMLRKKGVYVVNVRINGPLPALEIDGDSYSNIKKMGKLQLLEFMGRIKNLELTIEENQTIRVSPVGGVGLLNEKIPKFKVDNMKIIDAIKEIQKLSGVTIIPMTSGEYMNIEIASVDLDDASVMEALDALIRPISTKGWSGTLTGMNDGFKPSIVLQIQ